jgi:hypothetical protein
MNSSTTTTMPLQRERIVIITICDNNSEEQDFNEGINRIEGTNRRQEKRKALKLLVDKDGVNVEIEVPEAIQRHMETQNKKLIRSTKL